MTKIVLATGTMVGFAYATEFFIAWYGGNGFEQFAFVNRAFGPYAWAYWTMVFCNVVTAATDLVQEGTHDSVDDGRDLHLCEHRDVVREIVITVTSLSRDFLPSSWGYFKPTPIDVLNVPRQLRPVLHAVPAVLSLLADGRDVRGESRDASAVDDGQTEQDEASAPELEPHRPSQEVPHHDCFNG